jgi:hypothetical protein
VIGAIGLALVIAFASVVVALADWGVGLGGGSITDPANQAGFFWRSVVALFVHAWVYSYFWSASTVIYLILRRDVDGTSWHDVYLPAEEAETFAGDLEPKVPAATDLVESGSTS